MGPFFLTQFIMTKCRNTLCDDYDDFSYASGMTAPFLLQVFKYLHDGNNSRV